MDTETARTVLYVITAIGGIVWLLGMQFVARSFRLERDAAQQAMNQFTMNESPPGRLLVGRAEVEGRPDALAARAASILAKGGAGLLGPVKILRKTEDRVVFEGADLNTTGQPGWRSVRRGQIQFTALGHDRTAIDYAVEIRGGRGLLLGGTVSVLLGLVALCVGFTLILTLVVPAPNPAVRAQTFQMVQVVHFLWPPFLFGALYRAGHRSVRAALEVFAHNLPYHDDSP